MRIWLKEKRESLDMTMAQIAQKLGISESYYCMIENGNRQQNMDIALVAKLSTILGMSLIEIANAEERKESV